MEFLKKIQGGIYNGIGFLLVIGLTGVVYGAYTTLSNVESGATLTSTIFNQVLENQRTLKTTLDGVSTQIVPAGFVGAFNLSTCPTGWIAANGSNGTPDLRGEFIRGLDNGRGVDSGRTLSSSQVESYKIHAHYITTGDIYNPTSAFQLNDYSGDFIASGDNVSIGNNAVLKTNRYYTETSGGTETRPRNVALLYCVKQ